MRMEIKLGSMDDTHSIWSLQFWWIDAFPVVAMCPFPRIATNILNVSFLGQTYLSLFGFSKLLTFGFEKINFVPDEPLLTIDGRVSFRYIKGQTRVIKYIFVCRSVIDFERQHGKIWHCVKLYPIQPFETLSIFIAQVWPTIYVKETL